MRVFFKVFDDFLFAQPVKGVGQIIHVFAVEQGGHVSTTLPPKNAPKCFYHTA